MKKYFIRLAIILGFIILFLIAKYVPFMTHRAIDTSGILAESCLGHGPECMEKFNKEEKVTFFRWLAIERHNNISERKYKMK